MPHDQEGVKAQGCIDDQLACRSSQQGGQPARLSRVHQLIHHVVLLYQLSQPLCISLYLAQTYSG